MTARSHGLEIASRVAVVAVLAIFVRRAWIDYAAEPVPLLALLVASECVAVLCVVTARFAGEVDRSVRASALTIAATFYLLFLDVSDDGVAIAPALGFGLQVGGVCLQIASKLWLGRSFGLLPANRGVVSTGPYALVRHPIYLGYFLNHVGFLLQRFTLWNLALYAVLYAIQLVRIGDEERVLLRDASYRAYAERVRKRFIPFVW